MDGERMDYIAGLNRRQEEAVLYGQGPLLILAGAGSGKTKVLTHRIAYLIEEKEMNPANIMAITFTNKAADEMKGRLELLVKSNLDGIWAGTFHSICVRILRYNIEKIGYTSSFSIYDRDDQITVVRQCMKELNINDKMYSDRGLLNSIGRLKDSMVDPLDFLEENRSNIYKRTVGQVYQLYEKTLRDNNALDFDDLILKTVELLEKDQEVLDYYSRRFKYIFVDEFQDTNGPQYKLVSLLASHHRNLCVVGDDDQSIYGFRGADISNILNFEGEFKDAKVIKLEQNYRSTSHILDTANKVIRNNRGRKDKTLYTEGDKGEKVKLVELSDSDEEANFVAREVESLKSKGFSYSDMAILYRTNAQSRTFEQEFMKRQIPYKLVGGVNFYSRKEIKDLVAYLKLVQNPTDDVAFRRIINTPKRGIGDATIAKIETYANKRGESLYSAILSLDQIDGLSKRAKNNLKEFSSIIVNFMAYKEVMGVQEYIEKLLEESGYIEELERDKSIESETRIQNLREFISVAEDFERQQPDGTVEDFLSGVTLLSDLDKTEELEDSLTMITVHSAKGLEYPVVFLVGMEEGLFPSSRSIEEDPDVEEERRLCYVAITRAEDLLYISYSRLRSMYGRTNYTLPSRFVDELPDDYVDRLGVKKVKRVDSRFNVNPIDMAREKNRMEKELKESKASISEDKKDIALGSRVMHKAWGVGTVVEIKDKADDKELVIAFQNKGIKRILLSIAPLKKI